MDRNRITASWAAGWWSEQQHRRLVTLAIERFMFQHPGQQQVTFVFQGRAEKKVAEAPLRPPSFG